MWFSIHYLPNHLFKMQRRKFIKSAAVGTSLASAGFAAMGMPRQATNKEIYELREYEIARSGRVAKLDKYLQQALIPALNKYGVKKVGVFKEISESEPVKVYVLIPYKSPEDYFGIPAKVSSDKDFIANSKEYDSTEESEKVFFRLNTKLMTAFDGLPEMIQPGDGKRIFELRTYEGYNEDAVKRKIDMFNKGELPVFFKTGLNPVFFGEAIAGKDLPCLTYMVTFKDMEERDKNWDKFRVDPDWKKMSGDPKYANTVSKISKTFLEPTEYSQI